MNIAEIRAKTVSISHYLERLNHPFKDIFLTRKQIYSLKQETVNYLRKFAHNYLIVAFSAEWCKDCASIIPVLALISEATGLEVKIFGGLKKDVLNPSRIWRIPPSPPEVEAFNIDKIPAMIILDSKGNEIARIVESPKTRPTLEEEVLNILDSINV